ncbi:MAG: hypothetical protein ABI175_00450 [Polyangiales bacterium]
MPLHRRLSTPPIECLVPDGVFDAFGWCASDVLEWRRPDRPFDLESPVDGSDPARMVFVFHRDEGELLPRELARLHAPGLDLRDEQALAPYAIDDATDTLFEKKLRPRDVLWLAADNLNALFWGLHDWAHFHNHGPFETAAERAWTELQCDASALVWLWGERAVVGLDDARWEQLRGQVAGLCEGRFASAGLPFDARLIESTSLRARTSGVATS